MGVEDGEVEIAVLLTVPSPVDVVESVAVGAIAHKFVATFR